MMLASSLKNFVGLRRWLSLRQRVTGVRLYPEAFTKNKCIFIHIPKTAGTSIGEALFGTGRTGHFEWIYYKEIDSESFSNFFKFAFVRNPLDRVVSAYFYLCGGGKNASDAKWARRNLGRFKSFDHFVQEGLPHRSVQQWGHFKRQSDFICDGNTIVVDAVGHVETIDSDFSKICTKIGINAELKVKNRSIRKTYENYFKNSDTLEAAIEIYRKDIEIFGYEKSINSLRQR